ncbi:MAG: hypothetical protein OXH85_11665 [Truepera sp.]|nr:hypothetical protein [Truepera sp.]
MLGAAAVTTPPLLLSPVLFLLRGKFEAERVETYHLELLPFVSHNQFAKLE